MDVRNQRVGVGVVIRNHLGWVMASSVQWLEASFSPQVVEAVAILRGIEFVVDTGLVPAVVKYDVLGVVNLINYGQFVSTEVGLVVDDIVPRICSNIVKLVGFVPRKANFVAHYLSKMAQTIS